MSLILTGNASNITSSLSATVSALANNGSGAIRVTTSAPHLFGPNDYVFMATSVASAQGYFNITVIDATHFDLQGSTYVSTGTGTATDTSLTPQIQFATDGDTGSLQLSGMVSGLQGIVDRTQALKLRTGKWRLFNQFQILGGAFATPIISNPWSNNVAFSSPSAAALANASWLIGGSSGGVISDGTNVPPVFEAGDLLEYSLTFTMLGQCNGGSGAFGYINIGASIASGGVISTGGASSLLGVPMGTAVVVDTSPTLPAIFGLSGSAVLGSVGTPWTDAALTICARVDAFSTATNTLINLIGGLNGFINHYRPN